MKRVFLYLLLSTSFLLANSNNQAMDIPTLYSKNSNMQMSLADDLISNDLILKGNEAILDIGCGDGKLTKRIADKIPQGSITAVDLSESMINFAKANNSNSNISYLQMSAEEINKIDKEFDVIIVFSAFHWFSHPEKVLEKMASKLKKGGKIYIISYPAESQDWPYYKDAMLSREKWKPYFENEVFNSMFSASKFDEQAKKLNLTLLKNQVEDQVQVYSNLGEFKDCVKGWLIGFSPNLPLSEYDEYTEAVIEKGKHQFYQDANGKLLIPYKSIKIILTK